MKKASYILNVAFVVLILLWFLYPKQNSARKETKHSREQVRNNELLIQSLLQKIRVDSILKAEYLKDIDSLENAKRPIQQVIIQKNEDIKKILDSPNLSDSALYLFFSNVETNGR